LVASLEEILPGIEFIGSEFKKVRSYWYSDLWILEEVICERDRTSYFGFWKRKSARETEPHIFGFRERKSARETEPAHSFWILDKGFYKRDRTLYIVIGFIGFGFRE
jgi:hypothetical protein